MTETLNVLVVEDSPTTRQLIVYLINNAPGMRVIAEAHNGHQAVQLTRKLRPHVVLMDIVMPQMDGLEATREIMSEMPTPIVIMTASLASEETDVAFQAVRLGALVVIQKPASPKFIHYQAQVDKLISTVRAMADVRVIHHRKTAPAKAKDLNSSPIDEKTTHPEIVAIISSTGGPAALSTILKGLPRDFPLPVVIVQHISAEFLPSLVEWLQTLTPLPVQIAQAGITPQAGNIYFAPGDAYIRLSKFRRFELDTEAIMPYMPSGDILLDSLVTGYGKNALGVVLTGMGSDGARGLKTLANVGATTLAQDEATSVVFGMPGESILIGAAQRVLSIQAIAETIARIRISENKLPIS